MIDALITFSQAEMLKCFRRVIMNLLEILNFSKEYLQKYSFSKPRLESEKVISNVLKLDRITLYAYFDMELSSEQKRKGKNIS